MSPADPDRELTRLFLELRRADEASAPDFRQLLARARAEKPVAARWISRACLAAALVALAVALVVLRRPAVPRLPAAAQTLAQWKAPTDVLLRTPGAELLDRLPALAPSIPSYSGFEYAGRNRGATPHSFQ